MGEALNDEGVAGTARQLARLYEPFHSITYYTPEILELNEHGYKGWWHAYFAYRPAPMGPVPAPVVTSVFYNFAPRMVERAVPGVWDIRSPDEVTALRLQLVDRAIQRIYGDGRFDSELAAGAELARRAIEGCDVVGRPVYAAYSELEWPDQPAHVLWHACTLLREHRGDSHNIALAAAELDGVECHVMMAARGHGNRPTILGIRGWTEEEWDAAVEGLAARGWVDGSGEHTADGRAGRSAVERHTDELASQPLGRLSEAEAGELVGHLQTLVGHLMETGEVSGVWPPPHLIKAD